MHKRPKLILRNNCRVRRPVPVSGRPGRRSQSLDNRRPSIRSAPEDNVVSPPINTSRIKFAGPIKIIVIEPKSAYLKQVVCAVGTGLSDVSIGGVNMAILIYSVHNGDWHAIVFSLAYHFFSAQAILSLHYANGWSTPLRLRHRRYAHICLQMSAILCATAGTLLVVKQKGITYIDPHVIIGEAATIFVILSAKLGIFAFIKNKPIFILIHTAFGITAFVLSSTCIIFGLLHKSFMNWAGSTVVGLLVSLIIFYSIFMVTSTVMNCISRIKA